MNKNKRKFELKLFRVIITNSFNVTYDFKFSFSNILFSNTKILYYKDINI